MREEPRKHRTGLTERGAHPSQAARSERLEGRDEASDREGELEPATPRAEGRRGEREPKQVEMTETARAPTPLFLAASGRGGVRTSAPQLAWGGRLGVEGRMKQKRRRGGGLARSAGSTRPATNGRVSNRV